MSYVKYAHRPSSATSKFCRECDVEKPLTDFSLSRPAQGNQRAVYRSNCKECCAAYARKWAKENTARASARKRKSDLKGLYGMTVADYDALLASQGGVCGICGQGETAKRGTKTLRMPVDHDHVTGDVRGILCHRCNRALGLLGDNAFILRRAISYIQRPTAATRKAG